MQSEEIDADRKKQSQAKGTIKAKISKFILIKIMPIVLLFFIIVIIVIAISGESTLKSYESFTEVLQRQDILKYVTTEQNENGYYYDIDGKIIDEIKEQLAEQGYEIENYNLKDELLEKLIAAEMSTEVPKIGEEGLQGTIHVNRFYSINEKIDGKTELVEKEVLGLNGEEELTYIAPNEEKSKYTDATGAIQENINGNFQEKYNEIIEYLENLKFKNKSYQVNSSEKNVKIEDGKIIFDAYIYLYGEGEKGSTDDVDTEPTSVIEKELEIEEHLNEYAKFFTLGKLLEDGTVQSDLETISIIKYDKDIKTYVRTSGTPPVISSMDNKPYRQITYTISVVSIPFRNLVSNYSIPVEFQTSLLQISNASDWISKLSDVVIKDSSIDLTLHDSLSSENETVEKSVTTKDGGSSFTVTRTTNIVHNISSNITKVKTWLYNKNILYEVKENKEGPNVKKTSHTSPGGTVVKTTTITSTIERTWIETVSENEDVQTGEWIDYNPFLRLWKNSTGNADIETEKDEEGNDVPINDKFDKNGKKVIYKDGNLNVSPADYVVKMSDILLENLSRNQSTQNYEIIMRYLLYIYTGDNKYGETDVSKIIDIYNGVNFFSVSQLYGGTIQEKIWFALIDAGFSEEAAAGAMGNIDYESGGINPSAVEGGYTEDTGGIGICQWTNNNRGDTGRNSNLKAYAKSKGVTWQDEDTQIEFLLTELTGEGAASGYAYYGFLARKGYSKDSWENATTVEEATKAFCYTFERPSDSAAKDSINERIKRAKEYYNEFHGRTREYATFNGNAVTAAGYTFPHYLQNDYNGEYGDSTIAAAGCGPTSLSMILSGFTRNPNVNPITLVNNLKSHYPRWTFYYSSGVGSVYSGLCDTNFLQKYYNCKSRYINSESEAISALEAGKAVIGREDGHVLAFIPVPNEYKNQGYKFYVLDSARGHNGAFKSFADFMGRTGATGVQAKYIIEPNYLI